MSTAPTAVFVFAGDPITEAGVIAQVDTHPDLRAVDRSDIDAAAVALVAGDRLDDETLRVVRAVQRNGCPRVVLLATTLMDGDVVNAAEAGVIGIVRRENATPSSLATALKAAARGEATIPGDLLGGLMNSLGRTHSTVLQPNGMHLHGLTDREIAVLKQVAEGMDTKTIAGELCYSERTIKNIITDVTRRFGLKNRSHAVAYAVRQGVI